MLETARLSSLAHLVSRCRPVACVAAVVWLAACEGDERTNARDDATQAACDYFSRCDMVGPSQMFASRDECEIKQRAFWEDTWPAESCDGQISPSAVSACLTEIDLAQCGNVIDFVSALDKCQRSRVCSR